MHFSGTVQKIFANPFRGKTLRSFTLQGAKGFFNTGEKPVSFVEGQQVEFEAKEGKREGNFDVDFASIKVVQGNAQSGREPAQAAGNVQQRSGGAARSADIMSKDDYWRRREENDLKKDKIIQRQSCRNSAIALAAVVYDGADVNEKEVAEFVSNWTAQYEVENSNNGVVDSPAPTSTPESTGDWK